MGPVLFQVLICTELFILWSYYDPRNKNQRYYINL